MLMTPKQLSKMVGVTPQTITAWCRNGLLVDNADIISGCWVIRWSELMMASLPVIGSRLRTDGKVAQIVGKRPRGRPPGSRNKRPRQGVKRP